MSDFDNNINNGFDFENSGILTAQDVNKIIENQKWLYDEQILFDGFFENIFKRLASLDGGHVKQHKHSIIIDSWGRNDEYEFYVNHLKLEIVNETVEKYTGTSLTEFLKDNGYTSRTNYMKAISGGYEFYNPGTNSGSSGSIDGIYCEYPILYIKLHMDMFDTEPLIGGVTLVDTVS